MITFVFWEFPLEVCSIYHRRISYPLMMSFCYSHQGRSDLRILYFPRNLFLGLSNLVLYSLSLSPVHYVGPFPLVVLDFQSLPITSTLSVELVLLVWLMFLAWVRCRSLYTKCQWLFKLELSSHIYQCIFLFVSDDLSTILQSF